LLLTYPDPGIVLECCPGVFTSQCSGVN